MYSEILLNLLHQGFIQHNYRDLPWPDPNLTKLQWPNVTIFTQLQPKYKTQQKLEELNWKFQDKIIWIIQYNWRELPSYNPNLSKLPWPKVTIATQLQQIYIYNLEKIENIELKHSEYDQIGYSVLLMRPSSTW